MARILVIEDESILRKNIVDRLRGAGHDVVDAGNGEAGVELATLLVPDLVITDLRLPGMDGLAVLREIKRANPRSMVVMVTAHGSQKTAVEAVREGAYDYLTKPVELKELVLLVDRAVSHCRALDGLEYAREADRRQGTLEQIIGVSENVRELKNRIRQLASSPAASLRDPPTVLIIGETGTGKDLVAHAIHNEGPRKNGPFVHVNCTAVSESLFESELFGHLRGAFTDAKTAKKGLFEVAHSGTIFLDEIGHLGPAVQAKLLLTLEKRTIRPVGAVEERSVDVHIIAATNRDLQKAIAQGEFRSDLYHRLRVFELRIDPLRNRQEDILPLAEHFVRLHARRFGSPVRRFSPPAMAALQAYNWPGNVRELSHTIESALLVCDGDDLSERHLRLAPPGEGAGVELSLPGRERIVLDFEGGNVDLEEIELRIIRAAYEYSGANLSKTARMLGLTREAVRYRLGKSVNPAPAADL
jgi:DNA-binding NtrC family response regulator